MNEQALAADDALDAELGKQNFAPTKDWRGHDGQFLWYAALMEGRGELALQTARASAKRAAKSDSEFGEFTRSRPLLTLLRLERWTDVLGEPAASGSKGMAKLLSEYAHGVAFARSGQKENAARALATLDPLAAAVVKAHGSEGYGDKALRGIAQVAQKRLQAEVALAEGRGDAALAEQTQAITLGKDIDEAEPPLMAAGSRLVLGDMQLRTQRWTEAEQTFRADLAEHPKSGWATRGLASALRAQGRHAEADALRATLLRDWRSADATLLAAN